MLTEQTGQSKKVIATGGCWRKAVVRVMSGYE
jgi:hypothetical protein